jgi:DNA-binding NarL/FixJ family response regulator
MTSSTMMDGRGPDGRVRALVVDDHPLFRDGICRLLAREPTLDVLAAVGSAGEALEVARAQTIDLAIVDLVLPLTGGLGLTKRLKDVQPRCKILGLSVLDDPVRIAAMMRAGADGFAIKTQLGDEILDAVRAVLAETRYLAPAVDAAQVERLTDSSETTPLERLTNREREVYELLVEGNSNERIAGRLFIARRTVETHRQHIMKKLQVCSVAELVRLAYKLGT